jgi:hypothetical protein
MLPYNQPMNKLVLGLGAFVGSSIGGYIPLLWDGSMFSFVSLPFSLIGGILLGYRAAKYFGFD